jgi:hypothetical protein
LHLFVALFDILTAIRCMQGVLRNMQPRLHILPATDGLGHSGRTPPLSPKGALQCLEWIVGASWACWESEERC